MTEENKDQFTTTIPKDSRKRLPIPRDTYELLRLMPGDTVTVTIEVRKRAEIRTESKYIGQ